MNYNIVGVTYDVGVLALFSEVLGFLPKEIRGIFSKLFLKFPPNFACAASLLPYAAPQSSHAASLLPYAA